MGTGNYTDQFKQDAVAQITERGYPIKEVSERLGGQPGSVSSGRRPQARPKRTSRSAA